MFGVLEFIIALALMIAIIVFFVKFSKKPAMIIMALCYLFIGVAVFSAGLVVTIPMPKEEIQIDIPDDCFVKLYSVRSDGRVYAFYNNEEGNICLKEIFNNDIGKNLENAVEISGKVTLSVPIGEGRSLTFLGKETDKIRVIFGENITTRDFSEDASERVEILFGNTNRAYDNFIKVLRLALFVFFVVIIMTAPFIFVYKHNFKRYNKFFKRNIIIFLQVFNRYKWECILCLIGILISYVSYIYMDFNAYTAWSLEYFDAILRGGFDGYLDIGQMDLWNSLYGGVGSTFNIPKICLGIWNLPILLIHYAFNTSYIISDAAYLWSKLFLELFTVFISFVAFKIVICTVKNKSRGLLAFILCLGSVTTFLSVGYSGQDDVVDLFLLVLGIYFFITKKNIPGMICMILSLIDNPQMILFISIAIITISKNLKNIILNLSLVFIFEVFSLKMLFGESDPSLSSQNTYMNFIFDTTTLDISYGKISIFAIAFVLICLFAFFICSNNGFSPEKNMLYYLCITSILFYIFTYGYIHRFQIPTVFIILYVTTIDKKDNMNSAIGALCLFEYFFAIVISSVHNNYYNFSCMPTYIQNLLCIETMPDIGLYNYFYRINNNVSIYIPILYGAAIACIVWIWYSCHASKNSTGSEKIVCRVPHRFITALYVSSTIIIIGVMFIVGAGISYFNYEYSDEATGTITTTSSVQEYYRGKSADWIQVGIKPYTNGMNYSDSLMVNMDILDSETGDTVGSYAHQAKQIKDSTIQTFKIDDIDIESNKWYIIKFYFTGVSEGEDPIIMLYRTEDGSSNEEKHFALVKENGQTVKVDYDFVGEVFTGKK